MLKFYVDMYYDKWTLQSYSPQSKASGVLKLGGDKSFLIAKNIAHY